MLQMILSISLAASSGGDAPAADDARLLIATIEALQQPVEDFQCEYEGTIHFRGEVAEREKVGADGLADLFSGIFIWKRGGDTHSESLHRRSPRNTITRESLVVRAREHQAEFYNRGNDAPVGIVVIRDPKDVTPSVSGVLGQIFLIDELKRIAADERLKLSVSDDQIDGRPLKALSIGLKDVPDSLTGRYWIDLRRNGHVVRAESYMPGGVVALRLDIELAPFKVGDVKVWMPISGSSVGYAALEDTKEGKRPVITKEPTVLTTINVLVSTLEFNKRPGPEAFTIKYKPGTPVSDQLRRMTYEFGQQKIDLNPTKADAEKMLNEQLVKADEQKSELAAAPASESFDWSSWLAWGFGGLVLVSSAALWIQRRRH